MKSIDNLTLIQIINRYKDIIGDDLESFIYSKIFDDKNILLLANTNAAKNNLQDRINAFCDCYTVHDYIKNKNSNKIYDGWGN